MNLVFYYENPYNPDHLKGTFLEGIETNNSSTSKNRRNRKSKKTVSRDFEKNTTKKASENGKTKISSNGQSGVAATNKAKQPWWKAKSDKKENGKIKRRWKKISEIFFREIEVLNFSISRSFFCLCKVIKKEN